MFWVTKCQSFMLKSNVGERPPFICAKQWLKTEWIDFVFCFFLIYHSHLGKSLWAFGRRSNLKRREKKNNLESKLVKRLSRLTPDEPIRIHRCYLSASATLLQPGFPLVSETKPPVSHCAVRHLLITNAMTPLIHKQTSSPRTWAQSTTKFSLKGQRKIHSTRAGAFQAGYSPTNEHCTKQIKTLFQE